MQRIGDLENACSKNYWGRRKIEKPRKNEQAVLNLLQDFHGEEPLKQLFWTELGYDRINRPLSRRGWNQTAERALAEDPILLAGGGKNNDFHVVYGRLAHDKLLISLERPAVTQLLRDHPYALFVFSNRTQDNWHFINVKYETEIKRRRLFRRISVKSGDRLRTASERLSLIDVASIGADLFGLSPLAIQERHDEAFDVESVTKEFYRGYEAVFRDLEMTLLAQKVDRPAAHDYALQFLNRTMFLYFIQRKRWLGDDAEFLRTFWDAYQRGNQPPDTFVENWLNVLFFEAFNRKTPACHRYFPKAINDILSLAPYLNGGLYAENKLDESVRAQITDSCFSEIFKFFENYNFTIAEDSPLDKEVAVDPEMIGKVYESLVNVSEEVDERGEAGIFYTPRTEIDLMCRLALADYLSNHLSDAQKSLLNQLVFSLELDEKAEADHALAEAGLWPAVRNLLQEATILDPACGSGSFLVGMLHILDDLLERAGRHLNEQDNPYERKKQIIGRSLYGVDVMEWACHVAELRLWLAMIVDFEADPAELHVRRDPLLPHFSFKIRCGDSLVQEIAGINLGHARNARLIKRSFETRIKKLKSEKLKFFNNDETCKFRSLDDLRIEEKRLFLDLLAAREQDIRVKLKTIQQTASGIAEDRALFGRAEEKPTAYPVREPARPEGRIEYLKLEYETVNQAIAALKSGMPAPFVWDIAFAEIFEEGKQGFDIVVGNPPYVRQESISAPTVQGLRITSDKKEYKNKLALAVYRTYEKFFGYRPKNNSVAHKIDAKSDLYIYFYFIGLSLLNPKGSFCFVTSNSWLDVGYGADLQEFLLKHSHVKMILDNQVRRTFAGADVNTIIALLLPPDDGSDWALEKTARFVMFRVPYEQILSPVIFDEVEGAEERKATQEYRVFPIKQERLLEDGCEIPDEGESERGKSFGPLIKVARYIGNKWGGKYLRAPDIYWTILEKGKGKLARLGNIAEVRFGIKTGANEFFYLDDERIQEWGIEPEFLRPVIKSPRGLYAIRIPRSKDRLLWCQKDKSSLRGTNVIKYIKYGESKGYHLVPSCKNRRNWYSLKGPEFPVMLWPSAFFERHIVYECPKAYVADKVFYTISGDISPAIRAWLNCSFVSLLVEVEGYQLNHGGIFVTKEWLANIPVIKTATDLIKPKYERIATRTILLCEEEHKQEDRRDMDSLFLKDIFGVVDVSFLRDLYSTIEYKVAERIHKARREKTIKGRNN